MKAYWLTAVECCDLPAQELTSHGVQYEHIPVDNYQARIEAVKLEQGYVTEDIVELGTSTAQIIKDKFFQEHSHSEDEVRYVLEGEGIFDIRSKDDCWMRVTVSAGDLIIVPKGRNHRFQVLGPIKTLRLFKDQTGWLAHPR